MKLNKAQHHDMLHAALDQSMYTMDCTWIQTLTCTYCMQGKLSKAADIYAVGVLMYECSAQQRAWAGLSLKSVYDAVTAKRILLELPADLPTALKVSSPDAAVTLMSHWGHRMHFVPAQPSFAWTSECQLA